VKSKGTGGNPTQSLRDKNGKKSSTGVKNKEGWQVRKEAPGKKKKKAGDRTRTVEKKTRNGSRGTESGKKGGREGRTGHLMWFLKKKSRIENIFGKIKREGDTAKAGQRQEREQTLRERHGEKERGCQ